MLFNKKTILELFILILELRYSFKINGSKIMKSLVELILIYLLSQSFFFEISLSEASIAGKLMKKNLFNINDNLIFNYYIFFKDTLKTKRDCNNCKVVYSEF